MSIIKKSVKVKENFWSNLRLIFIGIVATLCFLGVSAHLVVLQFVEGKSLSEKAYKQQIKNQIISPNRGTIYDSNGEILAQSISVDTISINPGKITYSNSKQVENEVIAEGLSSMFNITYEEVIEGLNSGRSVVIIEKKVEKEKVDELRKWMKDKKISAGINIDEDSKRYYPYDTLASNLIGFCGTDNSGQTGLEQRWNDVLTGTAGKVITTVDAKRNAISDEDEQYVAPENGSNIYLTIDAKIQGIAEKYLANAMIDNSTATSGNVIVMNPQTGDILAMASNPYYNLNNPSDFNYTGYTEEEWNALESVDKSNALLNLWKNTNVSDTYEPGSTFKLITASVGLEEGIVQTDTPNDFLCTGSYVVAQDEDPISCWRKEPHGYTSLRTALEGSCNPAFMQLGQRIGPNLLYKYFKAFGLFETCGSDIAKSYKGTFYPLESVGPVELATTSFGQRFEISPLQLITAVSAICNDGVLVKPKIVKQIENTDTKSIDVIETENIRQVISKDTADKVKDMMLSVVTKGTGGNAKIEGYSIGGKSGTSEPLDINSAEGYVASFVAITPIENTQVVVLVALHGLQESVNHQGGQVAGPVARQILQEILPYLGISSSSTSQTENEKDDSILIAVPNVENLTITEARNTLQNLGFNVVFDTALNPDTTLVANQMPKYGEALMEDSVICLYPSAEGEKTKVQVPDIKDMTAKQAANALKSKNLNIRVDGTEGIVISQDPVFGTEVDEGTVVNVVIQQKLTDAQ